MRHTKKAFQTDAAVLLQKLLDMLAVLGCFTLLKPRRQRLQTERAQFGVPLLQNRAFLSKFVLYTGEQCPRLVFIH